MRPCANPPPMQRLDLSRRYCILFAAARGSSIADHILVAHSLAGRYTSSNNSFSGTAMLRILGSARRLCDGVTRREMLCAGGSSLLSLGLPDLWRLQASQPAPRTPSSTFGKAKRVLFLYLYGAAAQHELYDPKPDAPAEIRGDFRPIATAV